MKILITGGTGFLGSHLAKHLLLNTKNYIVLYSRCWQKQYAFMNKLKNLGLLNNRVKFVIGDVRSNALQGAMYGIDYVIHTAAIKEMNVCEYNVTETFNINVSGSQNVIACAKEARVKNCILISTDKAYEPINTYGVSKLMAEKLFKEAGYSVIRYGNVWGSSGSVLDVWDDMYNEGNELKITNPKATRFLIHIEEAIDLILEAIKTKDIFTLPTDLKAFSLGNLYSAFCDYHQKPINFNLIGLRKNEKMHESLCINVCSKDYNTLHWIDLKKLIKEYYEKRGIDK